MKLVVFRGAPKDCAGCHEDIHGGQFTLHGSAIRGMDGDPGADCASCHGLVAWKPARFDHETRSKFSLAGAHKEVRCGGCHKQTQELAGRLVIVYKQAPSQCSACHDPQ